MKHLRIPLLIAALAVAGGTAGAQDVSSTTIEKAKPSIVVIVTSVRGDDGRVRAAEAGSGFVIHKDKRLKLTFLATAQHVIQLPEEWAADTDAQRKIIIERLSSTGTLKKVPTTAEVIAEDRRSDIAVLAIREQPWPIIPIQSTNTLRLGDKLALLGFAAKISDFVAATGRVQRIVNGVRPAIEFSVPARPGQSGGPIINARGFAVAIVSHNNSKLNPRWHTGASANTARAMLNQFLRDHDRPELGDKSPDLNAPACDTIVGEVNEAEPRHSSPFLKVNIFFVDAKKGCRIVAFKHEVVRQKHFSKFKMELQNNGARAKVTFNLLAFKTPAYAKITFKAIQKPIAHASR